MTEVSWSGQALPFAFRMNETDAYVVDMKVVKIVFDAFGIEGDVDLLPHIVAEVDVDIFARGGAVDIAKNVK